MRLPALPSAVQRMVEQALNFATQRLKAAPELRLGGFTKDPARPKARRARRISWAALIIGAFLYGMLFTFLPPSFIPPLTIPLVLIAALVVWALPSSDTSPPRRSIRWLFTLVPVALIAWPNYLALDLPGLPWLTSTRIVIFPLTAVLLIRLSSSRKMREQMKQAISTNRLAVRFWLLFVVVQFFSVALTPTPVSSFQRFVVDQVYWTAMFFTACYVLQDRSFLRNWSWLLVGLAGFVSILGIWEWRIGHVPWLGHIPSFLQIEDDSVLRTLAGQSRPGSSAHRVQTTFGESLGCAEYLALTVPLLIHFMLEARKPWLRLLAGGLLPLILFTIFNTGARLGMVGFFASALLYGGMWAIRRWKFNPDSIFAPAIALAYPAFAAMFVAATFFVHRLKVMVWGDGSSQSSTDARVAQMHRGWPMVFEQPWGHGLGHGAAELGYTNGAGTLTIDTYTLALGLDYGVLGLLGFYGAFVTIIVRGAWGWFQSRDRDDQLLLPLSISLGVFLIIKSVYSQENNHPIAFMIMGAVCALLTCQRLASETPIAHPVSPVPSRPRFAEAGI